MTRLDSLKIIQLRKNAEEKIKVAEEIISYQKHVLRALPDVCLHDNITGYIPYFDTDKLIHRSCVTCAGRIPTIENLRFCRSCDKETKSIHSSGVWSCSCCQEVLSDNLRIKKDDDL